MKISSSKFYRLALLIPYFILIVLAPFFYFDIGSNYVNSKAPINLPVFIQVFQFMFGLLLETLIIVCIVYFLGAPYWLLPYTILVVFLWSWSLKKEKLQIYKVFIWAPFFLALLITALYALIVYYGLFSKINYLGDDIPSSIMICIFPASIAFGYLFIGITAWIYDSLRRRGIIADEENFLNLNEKTNQI